MITCDKRHIHITGEYSLSEFIYLVNTFKEEFGKEETKKLCEIGMMELDEIQAVLKTAQLEG